MTIGTSPAGPWSPRPGLRPADVMITDGKITAIGRAGGLGPGELIDAPAATSCPEASTRTAT